MSRVYHHTNYQGNEPQVGFEIEYAGIDLASTAQLIAQCWEGRIVPLHRDSIAVHTKALGEFTVLLDMQRMRELAVQSQKNQAEHVFDMEGLIEDISRPFIKLYYPNEIVTPPILSSQVRLLEPLVQKLRENGAQGTRRALTYAFGLHINSDVPSLKADILLAYMQAFVLLYEWLENTMHIDISRRLRVYAENYPHEYALHIINPKYQPNTETLIDDYITHTPTRNRGLDMFPVFMFMDEDRVRRRMDNPRIKKRPTFHFRMPNCEIDDPSWSIEKEWKRWQVLEALAWDHTLRAEMAATYPTHHSKFYERFTHEWLSLSQGYVGACA